LHIYSAPHIIRYMRIILDRDEHTFPYIPYVNSLRTKDTKNLYIYIYILAYYRQGGISLCSKEHTFDVT